MSKDISILLLFFVRPDIKIIFLFNLFFFQAEEITLTIGQAFELAYKKYLESRGKEMESKKQSMIMTKRIEILEEENKELKKRLADVAKIKGDVDVKKYMKDNNVSQVSYL